MVKVVFRSGLVRDSLRRERFIFEKGHNQTPAKPGYGAVMTWLKYGWDEYPFWN